jgi:hypothetical protein
VKPGDSHGETEEHAERGELKSGRSQKCIAIELAPPVTAAPKLKVSVVRDSLSRELKINSRPPATPSSKRSATCS